MKQPKLYLTHIIKAIDTIQKFLKGFSYESFLKDEKTQDAVIRNLEIWNRTSLFGCVAGNVNRHTVFVLKIKHINQI